MQDQKDILDNAQFRFYTFVAAIFAVLIIGSTTLFIAFESLDEENSYATMRAEMQLLLNKMALTVNVMDSDILNYRLSERQEYINEYSDNLTTLNSQLIAIEKMSADDGHVKPFVPNLKKAIEQKTAAMDALFRKVREKDKYSKEWSTLVAENKQSLKVVDSILTDMAKVAKERHEIRKQNSDFYSDLFYIILAASTFASLFSVGYSLRQFRLNQRKSQEEANKREKLAVIEKHSATLAKRTAGDLLLSESANFILDYFVENFDILAAKLYIRSFGKLEAVAAKGTKLEANKVLMNENLLTTVLNKKGVHQISDVPADYWKIESSLGESKPKNLIFFPFQFQGHVLGILEMASFSELSAEQLEIMESLHDILGIGISAAQSRTRVQHLLEETQQQAEELQTQQEELKTNNEELEQQTRALETQQQALHIKNQELEQIHAQLKEKATDLQKTSQYKSEFLANMSHELRTPLNGLLILSSLLSENKEKNLSEQQLEFVTSIHRAGNDLLTLINDILDLSKIEAKKLTMRPERFNVREFMDQVQKSFAPQMMTSQLDWKTELKSDVDDFELYTDRQRLEQILRNFISNAIKFTEKGSVTFVVEKIGAGDVKFAIRDTGIGISKEKQKLIFDAFEQEDTSISRRYGGTGLGLTISKELAGLLGGNIDLKSEKDQGSEFSVTIPTHFTPVKAQDTLAHITGDGKTNVQPQQASFFGKTERIQRKDTNEIDEKAQKIVAAVPKGSKCVLVVEDDLPFSNAVVATVQDYGFHPIKAEDGELALAILQIFTPDAILMDIKIPGISGLGLLEMIKQMPHLRHVPVHMISGLDHQLSALKMGALGYLTKPVTMEKVSSALERIEHLISDKLRRVLLIEDDKHQRMAITELIAGDDVEVVTAGTGVQAVDKIKTTIFDCIIVDLNLPDTSGLELLEQLNSMSVALPPIVIYTAKDLTIEEETHLKKFTESIIVKGARSPERLLDEVNLFLHRIESMLPEEKRMMLQNLRSQDYIFKDKTVLLVDDDLRNVFALTSALETRGMNVQIAKNGKEAVEAVKNNAGIDLVLMDIMMPVMDGYEAMKSIRAFDDKRFKDLPIIALTAKAMKEDHEKCISSGANDYLPKPINLTNLFSVLKVWLPGKDFI